MLKKIIETMISRIKGSRYEIDKNITSKEFLALAFSRFFDLVRFILKFGKFRLSFLGKYTDLKNKKNILIGNGVTIESYVTINALSKNQIVLSDNVTICKNTIIQGSGVITELGEGIHIGKGSGIGAMSFIGCQGGVYIGNDVIMGPRVNIHSENHNISDLAKTIKSQGVSRKGVRINDNCWIGAGVIILDGVTIGEGSVIAAGAVVTKSVPDFTVCAGIPAKVIKTRE